MSSDSLTLSLFFFLQNHKFYDGKRFFAGLDEDDYCDSLLFLVTASRFKSLSLTHHPTSIEALWLAFFRVFTPSFLSFTHFYFFLPTHTLRQYSRPISCETFELWPHKHKKATFPEVRKTSGVMTHKRKRKNMPQQQRKRKTAPENARQFFRRRNCERRCFLLLFLKVHLSSFFAGPQGYYG